MCDSNRWKPSDPNIVPRAMDLKQPSPLSPAFLQWFPYLRCLSQRPITMEGIVEVSVNHWENIPRRIHCYTTRYRVVLLRWSPIATSWCNWKCTHRLSYRISPHNGLKAIEDDRSIDELLIVVDLTDVHIHYIFDAQIGEIEIVLSLWEVSFMQDETKKIEDLWLFVDLLVNSVGQCWQAGLRNRLLQRIQFCSDVTR